METSGLPFDLKGIIPTSGPVTDPQIRGLLRVATPMMGRGLLCAFPDQLLLNSLRPDSEFVLCGLSTLPGVASIRFYLNDDPKRELGMLAMLQQIPPEDRAGTNEPLDCYNIQLIETQHLDGSWRDSDSMHPAGYDSQRRLMAVQQESVTTAAYLTDNMLKLPDLCGIAYPFSNLTTMLYQHRQNPDGWNWPLDLVADHSRAYADFVLAMMARISRVIKLQG